MSKFEEIFPLIYVINLDSRPDRLNASIEEFKKIGLTSINRMPGQVYTYAPDAYTNGAIGCMLSHKLCLEEALRQKKNVFIFEDDIEFLPYDNLTEIIDQCCEELESIDWSLVYFSGNLLRPAFQKSNRLAKLTHAQSTVAYGVKYEFIEKLLSYFPTTTFTEPIDMTYANRVIPENNCYITIPMIAIQRKGYSDIECKEVDYSQYLQKRYWENLVYTEGIL